MLDYVVWVCHDLQTLGAHAGAAIETWRQRVGNAYRALVNPMIAGYGDPYPPDVPPAHSPGIWPDIAASDIPGMTVRHQLVVVAMLAEQGRSGIGVRARPELLADLEERITRARSALDRGPSKPMPAEARSQPSAELLAKAQAEEKAIREHARRRSRQVRDLLRTHRTARRPSTGRPSTGRPSTPRPSTARPSTAKPSRRDARAKRGGRRKRG